MGQWRYTRWKSLEEEVTVLVGVGSPKEAGRAAPRVKAAYSFESRKREKLAP